MCDFRLMRSCRAVFLLSALLIGPASWAWGENWPSWRGPNQNGTVAESAIPVQWSPTENIRWKVPVPGNGTSTPIVWNQQVFLTATSGRAHTELHVFCYDLQTGKSQWERRLTGHKTPIFTQFPPARGHAMPSPVTDGKSVVALFTTGELAAYSLAGDPLWFRSLQEEFGEIDNDYGLAASPVLVGDQVLVQVDHARGSYLASIDLETGGTTWKIAREGISESWTTPVVTSKEGRNLAFCAGSGQLVAYDLEQGKRLWSSGDLARLCCPMPILVGDSLIVTSGPGGNTQRLNLSPQLSAPPERAWLTPKGSGFVPSGIVVAGRYFYASDRGILTCLDLERGEEAWAHRVGGSSRGSPVASGNQVIFTSLEGKSTVIEAAGEYRVIGGGDLGEAVSASPAIGPSCLIFRTEGHLVCVASGKTSRKTGS